MQEQWLGVRHVMLKASECVGVFCKGILCGNQILLNEENPAQVEVWEQGKPIQACGTVSPKPAQLMVYHCTVIPEWGAGRGMKDRAAFEKTVLALYP